MVLLLLCRDVIVRDVKEVSSGNAAPRTMQLTTTCSLLTHVLIVIFPLFHKLRPIVSFLLRRFTAFVKRTSLKLS